MGVRREFDPDIDVYLAGQRVPPGVYRQIGGYREVVLEEEGELPASFDGRVACYLRVVEMHHRIGEKSERQDNHEVHSLTA